MDTNKLFSLSRVAQVIKREVMENWKSYSWSFVGIYAAFAMTMIGNVWIWSVSDYVDAETGFSRCCHNTEATFIFMMLFGGLLYASHIMDNMVTKEKRISFLMLPASMVEKFVARFLMVTIGFLLTIVGAALLAEITRYLLLPVFGVPGEFYQSVLLQVFSDMTKSDGGYVLISQFYSWLANWCFWAGLLWVHSLYILGGSYWYKHPFLKTCGTLMAVLFVSLFLIGNIDVDTVRAFMQWAEVKLSWVTLDYMLALGIIFFSSFTLLHWWLSYRCFVRSQVIKPKFSLL